MTRPPDHGGAERQQWGCAGKWQFMTWADAERSAKRLNRRSQQRVRPYVCRFCGRVHLGGHGHEGKPIRPTRDVGWEDE